MENPKIAMRADANKIIGTGHIMRALAIAKALRDHGAVIIFITADESSYSIIREQGFQMVCLESNWKCLDEEVKNLTSVLQKYKIEKLIIDTYQITDNYFKKLKPCCKLYYMDDYGDRCYFVDGIINYNITGNLDEYQKLYDGKNTRLMIGTEFVPLREEFQNIEPIKIKKQIENVLVTTGGTDPDEISLQIAKMVIRTTEFCNINFYFVCGRFYKNSEILKQLEDGHSNIRVYTNVHKMSKLMLQSDLAISAGGSTLYELCACGVPTICFSIADNQKRATLAFEEKDSMIYCAYTSQKFFEDLKENILYLNNNYDIRCKLHEKSIQVTNGNGVYRMVDEIIEG